MIHAGEVTPGRRGKAVERTKAAKTPCRSNKAAGQERVRCVAENKERGKKHRPARKADKETAQAMELYAPPPGGHGVLDHRQTNRPVTEYGEETLWDDERDAGTRR